MLTSGLRPRPRCGKENRAARLRCKRPTWTGASSSTTTRHGSRGDRPTPMATSSGRGPTRKRGADGPWPTGRRSRPHVAEFDGNKARGAVVRMMQTAVVPKLDDPDGVPIPGLPAYRVKRIDVGTSAGKSRGRDAFTIIHEDAGRSWTSPSAWTPEAADAWKRAERPAAPDDCLDRGLVLPRRSFSSSTPRRSSNTRTGRRGPDDDRAALRRRAGSRGALDRSAHRRAGLARASARFVWLRQFEPRRRRRTW